MSSVFKSVAALVFFWISLVSAQGNSTGEATHQVITRQSELSVNQAPEEFFVGHAEFSRFPIMPTEGDVAPAIVRFEAGSYTNWHIHSQGQYLIVMDGEGRTQEWGKPIQTIRAGDVIWCSPGCKHWHGGGEYTSMSHVAISPVATEGESVTWLERVELPAPAVSQSGSRSSNEALTITLTERQLAIIPIAAFNATGDLEGLKPALEEGLNAGLSVNGIKEVLSHQYAYVGFPRSLNGLITFRAILEARVKAGINDPMGLEATAFPLGADFQKLGTETLKHLTNGAENTPMYEFAPAMDYALKAHLFGYLFGRDNLSHVDRELTTVATLAAVGNVNSQLISHLRVSGNLGISQQQLWRVIDVLEKKVDAAMAENAALQLSKLNGR